MVNLTSLDISNNPGGHGGMVQIFQKLSTSKICKLSVFELALGSKDIHGLSHVINSSTTIKELKIGDKNMSSECVVQTVEIILSSSSLEKVELWWIQCTPEVASKFTLLGCNNNLVSLRFVNCFVGVNLVISYITKALHKNDSLKTLGLPSRYAEWFQCPSCYAKLEKFEGRKDHKCDTNLDYECDIGTNNVKDFAEMLKMNQTLEELQIVTSKLSLDDVKLLRDALQENQTLKHLFLHQKVFELDPRIASIKRREILLSQEEQQNIY